MNVMRDDQFQRILLRFVTADRAFLKDIGYLLEPDDFKPASKDEGRENWIIAKLALEYFRERREPISGLLRTWVLDYADRTRMGEKQTAKLLDVVKEIQSPKNVVSVEAVSEKVITFKKQRQKKLAMEKLNDLQDKGELTDDAWYKICLQAVESFNSNKFRSTDFFDDVDKRMKRRSDEEIIVKRPFLMIDELDEKILTPKRGQLNLFLAFLKGGKSLALLWIALAYIFQNLNVLYITLEDDLETVEDRLDAAITQIAMRNLNKVPKKFKKRYRRMRRLIHSRIKIIDGTEGGWSVARIEDAWEHYRNTGFVADAIIIDYDEEIEPPAHYKGDGGLRRELGEVYKGLRRLAARRQLYMWTAAQSGRRGEGKKIISAGMVAEDISKIRKVALCISIGDGEWGSESKYLYIAAAKNTKQKWGFNIATNYECGIFYDRERTLRKLASERRKHRREKAS